jgi:hypothetical protein
MSELKGSFYPNKSFAMVPHSVSSGFRHTGLPARLYQ